MNPEAMERAGLIAAVQQAQGGETRELVAAMDRLEAFEEAHGRRFRGFPEVLRDHHLSS